MGDEKKYWHELTDAEIDELIEAKRNYTYIMENFLQPDWCSYPDALNGKMGCWSLAFNDTRKNICTEFCSTCECYKPTTNANTNQTI